MTTTFNTPFYLISKKFGTSALVKYFIKKGCKVSFGTKTYYCDDPYTMDLVPVATSKVVYIHDGGAIWSSKRKLSRFVKMFRDNPDMMYLFNSRYSLFDAKDAPKRLRR